MYLDDTECTKMTVPIGSALRCLLEHWDKKKRFTEAYTVRMTAHLIRTLDKENKRLGAGKNVPNGLLKLKRPKKKAFIKFSTVLRPR